MTHSRFARAGVVAGLVAVAVVVPAHPADAALAWYFDAAPTLSGRAELTAVAATSATRMWVAGEQTGQDSPTRAFVAHWDGGQLRPEPAAPAGAGVAVHLTDLETVGDGALAVGRGTSAAGVSTPRVERYTPGAGGTVVPNPVQDQPGELTGISTAGEWIVGELTHGDSSQTLTMRRDGAGWTRVPSPNPGRTNRLNAVASTPDGPAYAVGVTELSGVPEPLLLRWDGDAWTRLPCAGTGVEPLGLAILGTDDVWLAGTSSTGADQRAVGVHWDGAACHTVRSTNPNATRFNDVLPFWDDTGSALTDTSVLLAGYAMRDGTELAIVEEWTGRTLVSTAVPTAAAGAQYPASGISAIASPPGTTEAMWAVGWQVTGPTTHEQPAILRNS